MRETWSRRHFLRTTAALGAGMTLSPLAALAEEAKKGAERLFEISLAQWSLHRSIFSVNPAEMGWPKFLATLESDKYRTLLGGEVDPLAFAKVARREFDIGAVEYVNTFFFDRAKDRAYLGELKKVADGEGVRSLLIMCDLLGNLGNPEEAERLKTVENHRPWLEAAAALGCHSIRVNARSDASLAAEEQQKLAADGLRRLCEVADTHALNVLVENHGGLSSDASWLVGVMKKVAHERVGTLPDFGNFAISGSTTDPENKDVYDRYRGVAELMPYAKAVSAKSYEFAGDGSETRIDYKRMMKIVLDAGYHGHVGIEFEGSTKTEMDGIRATKALLERVREELGGTT
jgi:sugar phosphate isomerase/epimerase